ncbi:MULTISPECIES: cell division protein FtsZ [Pasteurellaceae]|uniref:Cell division protein FtsZ n=1 Tax=Pasteurella atlantica TaxID=2827233 RepID=A0AAW8CIX6_9PAST|nr:cell division protein FtsZ [Pasteurella atlantica]MBR0574036.1 cell division protein FtsZ [Pasteurella atlantica]MDP8039998.1 cell division protein FtsZ [Pasteurella atlantica]MDP8042112.1 cell division protein FtsZ [Pasteurella atlantica]MDP8044252.1 cell division protein FtsZ [Pasteurella atlantica]MDP8046311.1 cell division protein FtsZ [Pasteurella atlantica]
MFEPVYEVTPDAVIKVVGVGGGGGNALNHMVEGQADENGELSSGVEFFSVNTDAQALRKTAVRQTIQIGDKITKGLGAGANPNVGRQAAEDDRDALTNMLSGADMVFISAGMGGGTGTGAAPVIAEIAKNAEPSALTVAIVTKPFRFEGAKRMNYAEQGIAELSKHVDSLIIIPNDKLLKVLPKNVKMLDAFKAANDVLRNAVLGITDMITSPGLINVDFADVKTVMSEMGRAMMGTGIADGEGRAEKAAQEAVASPLLEDVDWSEAKGILVSITSGMDIELSEVYEVMDYIHEYAAADATVVFGTSIYPEMDGQIRVTLVATGIGPSEQEMLRANNMRAQHSVSSHFGVTQPELKPVESVSDRRTYTTGSETTKMNNPQPHRIDEQRLFSPSSIPGFLKK